MGSGGGRGDETGLWVIDDAGVELGSGSSSTSSGTKRRLSAL